MKKTATARIAELEEQVSRLAQLVEGRVGAPAPVPVSVAKANGEVAVNRRSRRDLLKLAGAAAAGAAGVVALKTVPASAATGGNMVLGQANNAGAITSLTETAATSPNPVFQVGSANAVPALYSYNTNASGTAFSANASSGATAIYAGSLNGGLGIVTISDTGTAIRASGGGISVEALGNGRISQATNPQTPTGGGAPTYTPAGWETVRDGNGVMWFNGPGTYANRWAPVQPGGINNAIFTAVSNKQYSLNSSDGATWQEIDPAIFTLTINPTFAARALFFANIDLWTATPGYNQDVGIFVQVNTGADQLHSWKESGGFAGAYSPNAAFVHAVYGDMFVGTTYKIRLKWKTNKDSTAANATIYAAAGSGPAPNYSPTRLSVQLIAI
jgi:hypothetical protein